VSDWHFEVVGHEHQVGSLGARMRVVVEFAQQLEVGKDEEVLPSWL
jgi:hypothetical protein